MGGKLGGLAGEQGIAVVVGGLTGSWLRLEVGGGLGMMLDAVRCFQACAQGEDDSSLSDGKNSQAEGKTACPLQSPSNLCSHEAVVVSSVWSGGQEELPA